MNVLSYSRRLAQGVLMLLFSLVVVAGVNAQCGDFLTEPLPLNAPVNITVNLTGTTAELNNGLIESAGAPTFSKDVSCTYQIADDSLFTIGATNVSILGTTYFDCSDITLLQPAGYLKRFIRVVNGIGGSGGPSTLNGQYREIRFFVYDQIPPIVPAIAAVTGNTGLAATICSVPASSLVGINAAPTDNCGVNALRWSLTGATTLNSAVTGINQLSTSGISFNVGVTTVTYTASDASGNTGTRSFTVTINDNTVPTITCPANITVTTDTGICTGDSTVLAPTTGDNCGTPTLFYFTTGVTTLGTAMMPIAGNANGVDFNLGTSVINYIARDAANNSATCSVSITVQDNQKPIITCPTGPITRNITAAPGCNYTVVGTEFNATATDNCTASPTLSWSATGAALTASGSGSMNGQVLISGTTTITWTAVDANMLSSTCTVTVNIKDNLPPTGISAVNQNFSVPVDPLTCTKDITWTRPAFGPPVDCSGPVVFTENFVSGPNVNVLAGLPALGTGGQTVNTNFPAGTTKISYKWTDTANNADSVVYTFVVTETILPTAICQPSGSVSLSLNAVSGMVTVNPSIIDNGSFDNCGIVSRVVSPATFNCTALTTSTAPSGILGQHVVTLTVSDAIPNSRTCTTVINIIDNIAPVVTCPANFTVNTTTANPCTANVSANITATDNCGIDQWRYQENNGALTLFTGTATAATLSFTGKAAGTYNYVIRVEDVRDNSAVCNFTVVVRDNVGPVADVLSLTPFDNTNNCPTTITVVANLAPGCNYKKPNSLGSIADIFNANNKLDQFVEFLDNCDPTTTPSTVSAVTFLNQTYFLGENQVTITKTDAAGNVGTCSFLINVIDNVDPVAKCQDLTVYLDNNGEVDVTALDIDDNSTDNCYLDLVYNIGKGASGPLSGTITFDCSEVGPNTVRLHVAENTVNGNDDSETCTVTVLDTIKPLITCPMVAVEVDLDAAGLYVLTEADFSVTISDNCNGTTINGVAEVVAGPFGSITLDCDDLDAPLTVYVQVEDDNNNTQTCAAQVLVYDVIDPNFAITQNLITINCGTPVPTTLTPNQYTANDACGIAGTPQLIATNIVTGPNCVANKVVRTITQTWQISDESGNTAVDFRTIIEQDTTRPSITVANASITLVSGATGVQCFPTGSYSATVTDACSAATTTWQILYADGLIEPGVGTTATSALGFSTGVNVITFTSVDACGNTATKTMTVTVIDNNAPAVVNYNQPPAAYNNFSTTTSYCGSQIQINNVPGNCGATFEWFRPYAGEVVNLGFATVFPDFTDCNPITVTETITAPNGAQLFPTVPFNGNNPINSLVQANQFLQVGTYTFNYTATAPTGSTPATNTTVCQFQVKIVDTQAPVLTCPATVTLNSICPTAAVPSFINLVNISDNCSSSTTVTQSKLGLTLNNPLIAYLPTPGITAPDPADGSEFNIVFTANDGTFITTCTTKVVLDDVQSPLPDSASLDNLVWDCGFAYVDAPTAKTNDCGMNTGATVYGTPGGVSAIGIATLPSNPAITTKYKITSPPGNYFITWSYNDGNGNVSTQLQQLTINPDTIKPVALCKMTETKLYLTAAATASLTAVQIDNGSYDQSNCGPFPALDSVKISLNQTNFTCADLTKTSVTLSVMDFGGNIATCTAPIKVLDTIAPKINLATVPADTTYKVCAIGFVPPAPPTVTATDNCSVTVSFSQVSTQGTAGASKYNYTISRTWTATDAGGNTAKKTQVITVVDDVKPVFATVPSSALNFTTALVTTTCSGLVTFKLANFVSDCAPDNELNIVVSPAYFSLADTSETLPVGSHTVNFTVTDPAGNSATAALTFVVKDVTKPTASCINGISVALNANGQAIVTPSLINNQSSDNCGSITLRIQELDAINGDTIGAPATQVSFDCSEADSDTQYPIILWVTDQAGNFNFCETSVVIQDNVAPVITCPANVTVACSPNPTTAFSTTALGKAIASDNCNNNVVNNVTYPIITNTDTPVNNGYTCSSFLRTFKASDLAGNMATCTQSITVIDTIKPVFTVKPPSDTIACNDPLVVAPTLIATDNCSPTDSVKVILVENSTKATTGCGKYNYTTTRTWTATDKCGNSTVHTQVVKVEDTAGPKFTGMPDTINILTANFPPTTNCTAPVALNAAQYFNECALLTECTINSIVFSPVLAVPITPTSLNVSGNYPVGTTKVIFTVTDPCGNVGKDSVIIIVKDNSAPIVTCNNNVEVALTNNGLATITVNDIDLNSNDNCGIATRVLSQTSFDCEDLGVNAVVLTVTDIYGNSNSCQASVEVTANAATGFSLDSIVVAPTFFGGANGSATVVATGGSNTFSYAWNTMATTASLTNIAAGTYTVAVSDQFSGCQQVINVVVPDGPKVKFTVGNATGAQNTIVKVPVTVDNFSQISGFTFTLNIPNTVVGAPAVPALANINPALGTGLNFSISGNTISVLYLNAGANNVSLPNGSVLFNICIQLSNAVLGTSSPVNIENAPVAFQVLRGTTIIPTDPVMNGSVQITAGLNAYDIAGDITPWQNPNAGIPNVDVTVTGPTPSLPTVSTTTTGIYQFENITANTNTTTSLEKTQSGNNKIDIIDQGLLLKHIFANATSPSPLTSPYQRIAADVNFDGQINIIDFALIQRLLLGTVQNLEGPNAKDWVFIPKSFPFPATVVQPFPNPVYLPLPVFPQTIGHTPLFQDEINDDFIGVRMGDLNGDAPLNIHGGGSSEERNGTSLKLRVQDRSVSNGETVSVAFKAKDFVQQNGYQFTFEFDPNALELQEVQAGAVPGLDADANFGTTLLSDGLLSTAWVNIDPVTIADDETLFTLVFKATAPVNALSQAIRITNDIVSPLSVKADGSVENVEFDFTSAVSATGNVLEQEFVLYQNQPNPFTVQTNIGFRLPTAERCTFRVYNSNGRLVKTVIGNFEKGYNAIQLRNSDLGGAGVYYYELSTPSFSDRKKLVFIN